MIGVHITVFTTIITLMENNMDDMEFNFNVVQLDYLIYLCEKNMNNN